MRDDSTPARFTTENGLSDLGRQVIDGLSDAVIVLDRHGHPPFANRRAWQLFGDIPADLAVEAWAEHFGFWADESHTPLRADQLPISELVQGRSFEGREVYLDPASTPRGCWLSVSGKSVLPMSPGEGGSVVTFHDFTSERRSVEILRASEKRHRLMFELSPVPMWVQDTTTGRFLAVNEAAARAYGYSPSEFLELHINDLLAREPDETSSPQSTLPLGRHPAQTVRHRRKDGSLLFADITSAAIDWHGRASLLVQARDITDHIESEALLEENERRYRLLFERNPSPILLWDTDTLEVIDMNAAAEVLYGATRDQLRGTPLTGLFPESELPRLRRHLDRLQPHLHLSGPWRSQTRDGRNIFVEAASSQIAIGGRHARLVHISDVTNRILTEAQARRSEDLMSRMVDGLSDAVFLVDNDWRITRVNPAAEKLAGRTGAQLLGHVLREAFPEIAGTAFEHAAHETAVHESSVEIEAYFEPGGQWLEMRAFPMGEGVALFFRDVTERKTRVEALHDLTDHLARTTGPAFFQELVARLAAIVHAQSVLLGSITEGAEARVRCVAAWHAGHPAEPPDFPVAGTPFAGLLPHGDCVIEVEADRRFPAFTWPPDGPVSGFVGVALRSPDGELLGVLAVMHSAPLRDSRAVMDILQLYAIRAAAEMGRQRVLEEIRRSEERFKSLAHAITDAVWDWDVAKGTIWRSDAFGTLFGITDPREVSSPPTVSEHIHPEDRDRISASLQAAIAGHDAFWQEEYRFRRGDGSYASILDRAIIMRDGERRAIRVIGGMTDISDRIDAAARLRDQAELLDRASDAIIVRDLQDRIEYWNRGAERLFGWTSAEAVGCNAAELFDASREDLEKIVARAMEHGEWNGEIDIHDNGGRVHTVNSRWTLVRGPNGEPRAFLNIDTDITEKKKLEAQFLRAQRLESIGILAGGIAHDLNNMLTPITMAVDVLKGIHRDDDTTALIESIESSAHRGADLVRQVLGFARGMEGKRLLVNPGFLARDIAKIARDTFPKNIRIRVECPREPWLVLGDPTQLHQVLLNLCVNARDAMPTGGDLRITVTNSTCTEPLPTVDGFVGPGDFSVIAVIDTGSGIPEEISDRIFDPFFSTKEPGKGTGLGLSTALAICKSHGGSMNVQSATGTGSTFTVLVPAERRQAREAGKAESSALPRGRGELIILVDDESYIRAIAKQTLEAYGYEVIVAAHGAEALAAYLENADRVALVVTDMMMPVMDGPALIRALLRINPDIRILAASGLNVESMVERARAAGVTQFLAKPYTAEAMLQKVAGMILPGE